MYTVSYSFVRERLYLLMSDLKIKIDSYYLLQKFPGKGGWTYAEIPEILQDKTNPFGWVKVKGSIDGYVLSQYKLMPMGNGKLFLPVKAAIRKKIMKEAGDMVHVVLEEEDRLLQTPKEIKLCLEQEPSNVLKKFEALSEGQRKTYLDWIYEAKTEETKVNRIASMIDDLSK